MKSEIQKLNEELAAAKAEAAALQVRTLELRARIMQLRVQADTLRSMLANSQGNTNILLSELSQRNSAV